MGENGRKPAQDQRPESVRTSAN